MSVTVEQVLELFLTHVAFPALDPDVTHLLRQLKRVEQQQQKSKGRGRASLPKRRTRRDSDSDEDEESSCDDDEEFAEDLAAAGSVVPLWVEEQMSILRTVAESRALSFAGKRPRAGDSTDGEQEEKGGGDGEKSRTRNIIDQIPFERLELVRSALQITDSDLWSWDFATHQEKNTANRKGHDAKVEALDVDAMEESDADDGEQQHCAKMSQQMAAAAAASFSSSSQQLRHRTGGGNNTAAAGSTSTTALEMQCWIDALHCFLTFDDDGFGDDGAAAAAAVEKNCNNKRQKSGNNKTEFALCKAGRILFFLNVSWDKIKSATRQQCVDAVLGSVFCCVDDTNRVLLPRPIELD